MFKKDSQEDLYYESENKINYNLFEGRTSKGYTSDIIFIFREPTEEDIMNGYCGEVVGWLYGGFEHLDLNFVESKIKEYEESLNK